MSEGGKSGWRPGKKDAIFAAVVIAVIVLLTLGTGKRTTRPVPNDEAHIHALKREQCMQCHGPNGVKPRPKAHHAPGDQCFLCHRQPRDWKGAAR